MKNNRIPSYYIGRRYKIEARKVIEDFDLSYNLGTAVTYLLRAEKKHDSPIECIQKAINHLEFELDKLKRWHYTLANAERLKNYLRQQ